MEKLQVMATALAASIQPHLGQPTIPPISWAQDGDIVHVVLADGRKVSASIQEINQIMFTQKVVNEKIDLDNLEVDLSPKKAPAKRVKSAIPRKRR
ncbi:MAG: hypothetical protein ABSA23_15630 [Anaerolineales bacterium]|jgi:hypothetical protein